MNREFIHLLLGGLQVGSKNAAFYLGKRIKVATRQAGSAYVHELGIGASDLEQRYRDGQVNMPIQLDLEQPALCNVQMAETT